MKASSVTIADKPSAAGPRTPEIGARALASRSSALTNEEWPRISIVTACLNRADTVAATMRSILEQEYPQLEYVVRDGGSTDGTIERIAEFSQSLADYRSEPDAGAYDAIQAGLESTSGEIMGWLNADDYLHRNALWTVGEIFREFPEVEWLMGRPTTIDARGRAYVGELNARWSRYRYLRGDYRWIQQESVFWRRSLWERAGGCLNTGYSLAADLDLWARFFQHARLYTTTALIGGFRIRPEQRSRVGRGEYIHEAERIVQGQPISATERKTLSRLAWFERFWLKLPGIGTSWRVRRAYERLFEYPPLIDYDHEECRFVFREEG